MAGEVIVPSTSAKYLGIQIDQKLNLSLQANYVKQGTILRAGLFRKLSYKNQCINHQTASRIYKTLCRPLIDYGSILFVNKNTKSILKKLEVAETSSLRKISKMRHINNPLHNPSNENLLKTLNIKENVSQRRLSLAKTFSTKASNITLLEKFCINRNQNKPSKFKKNNTNYIWKIKRDRGSRIRISFFFI